MIEFRTEKLENSKETALRNWLDKPEFHQLVAVIESKMIVSECEALKKAKESRKFPDKMDSAHIELASAIRYQEFLAVLSEVKDSKEPFELVKPSTSKT